jgi:hypothetical protein
MLSAGRIAPSPTVALLPLVVADAVIVASLSVTAEHHIVHP